MPQETQQATPVGFNTDTWADAIEEYEKRGGGPNARSIRNNNPGNLKYAKQFGATGYDKDGFAVFDSYDLGKRALKAQLELNLQRSPNATLVQHMHHYLGGTGEPAVTGEGDPFAYAKFIADRTGVDAGHMPVKSTGRTWTDIASQFDPMMPEDTYRDMKRLYFDNFIAPQLGREDNPLAAWEYFDKNTKRPSIVPDEKKNELRLLTAQMGILHGGLAPFRNVGPPDPKFAELLKGIEGAQEAYDTLQRREGMNPAFEQIPGEMAGASLPLLAGGELAEPVAAGVLEELPAIIRGSQIAHRALRGGMTFAAYEAGETTDKNKGVAALKGFVIGAAMDGGLSLPGKLLSRGVEGNADKLLQDALNAEKGVSLDADRVMSDHIIQDHEIARQEGRSIFVREATGRKGAVVQIKKPNGEVVEEPIHTDREASTLDHVNFLTQQGGEVLGIEYAPNMEGSVNKFLAMQQKATESAYTQRVLTTESGKADVTAQDMRRNGHPAEPQGDNMVVVTEPKKIMPSRDQLREKVAQFGGEEDYQQNLVNQIRQIWNPQVPDKAKRIMLNQLDEAVGTAVNDLLPDNWKVAEKINGIYKNEFEQWVYQNAPGQPGREINMLGKRWEFVQDMTNPRPMRQEELDTIEKSLRKKLPENLLPADMVPKPALQVEAARAIGDHVPDNVETVPTLDVEESRSSKVQRLYRLVTGIGFRQGAAGGVEASAERLATELGLDPSKINFEELGFAPNLQQFESELKGYEILQSAEEEIAQKTAATGTSVEEASAIQEAARKGEITSSSVERRIPPSERGYITLTDSGPKWVDVSENASRIRIKVPGDVMEELFPGSAGVVVYPGTTDYGKMIEKLGMNLDPNDPRPFHVATTKVRDYIWHENAHVGLYHVSGEPGGMIYSWKQSREFGTAAQIAAQLGEHPVYKNMGTPTQQLIEEAFVHAATALRTGDTKYLAQLAYWDTSIGRVLNMIEDFAARTVDTSFDQVDSIPIRIFRRSLDDVITRASSDRTWEMIRLARENGGLHFYEPEEGVWKYIDEVGKYQTFKDYGKIVDHTQELASAHDFLPSASIWAELRGVRMRIVDRGLEPTRNMPMPDHSLGQDQKWVGWKGVSGAFRPMLPWVADLDTKLNEVLAARGQAMPLYDRVKAVDDAVKAGDDWLSNQKEIASDFLKGNPKKQYALMDALTVESKYWPKMAEKLGLDAKDLQNLARAEQYLKDFQNDTHIPAFNYLREQLPKLRGFNFNTDFVYGRGAKLPSDMSFFHRAISEGALDPKDAHLGRFINFLIREGFEKKFTGGPIQELKKLVEMQDRDGKYILGATRWPLNNYVNYIRGIPDMSQQVITRMSADFGRMMGDQFKKVNPYLPEGFKLPEEVNYPGSIFNKLMTLSYVGALGARPAIFVRDVFQAATTTLPVLGLKGFIRGALRGLTKEGFERAETAGALLQKRQLGELWGDITGEMPASGNKFDQAIRLSSKLLAPSRWGHNVARAIAYNGEFDSTLEMVSKYRSGAIDAHELLTKTSFWFYDKPEINRLLKMATDANVPAEEVAHRSALQLVDLTLWPYRRGAQPTLLRTGVGRIFGQFGMWPMNYLDFLRRLGSKVGEFHGPALRTIATWAASNYAAASLMENIFHADVGKWFFLSPAGFGGSPHMELVQNLMRAPEETQQGRDARRKVLEYPIEFFPTSNEIKSILKAYEDGGPAFDDNGHLSDNFTRILGFKPLNEVHQENMENLSPEDKLRYEFGFKKAK